MTVHKGLLLVAIVAFILAAFNAGGWPWIPVGLAAFAAGELSKG